MKRLLLIIVVLAVIATTVFVVKKRLFASSNINISKEQIESFLSKMPPDQIAQFRDTPNGKEEFIQQLRRALAITQEAKKRGITEQPEVKGSFELAYTQTLVEIWKDTPEGKDTQITKEQVAEYYSKNPKAFDEFLDKNPKIKGQPGIEKMKDKYGEICIQKTYAEKAKIFDKPEFKMVWLIQQANVVGEKIVPDLEKQVIISDNDIKAYYEVHKSDYEEVKAKHILISTRPKDLAPPGQPAPANKPEPPKEVNTQELHKKAENLLDQLKKGADFDKLASENSDDPGSKSKGGELGFFRKGMMVKPFEEVAFALKPGELAPSVVETPFGFHIIKVEEHRVAPLDQPINDEVRNKLKEKKIGELLDSLAIQNRITVANNFVFPAAKSVLPPGHP